MTHCPTAPERSALAVRRGPLSCRRGNAGQVGMRANPSVHSTSKQRTGVPGAAGGCGGQAGRELVAEAAADEAEGRADGRGKAGGEHVRQVVGVHDPSVNQDAPVQVWSTSRKAVCQPRRGRNP